MSDFKKIRPLGKMVVVKKLENQETTTSFGIILSTDDDISGTAWFEVLSASKEALDTIIVGSEVLIRTSELSPEMRLDGGIVHMVSYDDCLTSRNEDGELNVLGKDIGIKQLEKMETSEGGIVLVENDKTERSASWFKVTHVSEYASSIVNVGEEVLVTWNRHTPPTKIMGEEIAFTSINDCQGIR